MLSRSSFMVGAALAALCSVGLEAQSIEVFVGRNDVTIQDRIRMSVAIEGSRSAEPQLPDLSDFSVREIGPSSEFQMINGRITNRVTYSYYLVPKHTGVLTIGPATVEIGGRLYQSRPVSIRVRAASSRPANERTVYTRATVSNSHPYVGEQVIFTWSFLRRVRAVANAQLLSQELEGFLVEDLGEVREYRTTIRGQQYEVSEIRKALFAQKEGTITIPPWELSCDVAIAGRSQQRRRRSIFDDFFGRTETETLVLRNRPIEIVVKRLPTPPADFSGLIGEFRVTSKVSKLKLEVGESVTQEITIGGSGNVAMIAEPIVDLASTDFKTYRDEPTFSMQRTRTGLRGEKSFHRALVPLREGDLTVPAVLLTYFEPSTSRYRQVRAPAVVLNVVPRSQPEDLRLTESIAPTTGKVAIRILADGLSPNYAGLDLLETRSSAWWKGAAWLVSPALLSLALLVTQRRRERLAGDDRLRRQRSALRTAQRELAAIENAGAAQLSEGAQPMEEVLSRVLRTFIGDCLGVEGTALTAVECVERVRRRGVEGDAAERLSRVLGRLEAAQYGVSATDARSISPSQVGELLKQLYRLLG